MSETTAAIQLPDFVDLEFARRLEMAEMIFPDCFEALRQYSPSDPIAAEHVAGGIAFFGGVLGLALALVMIPGISGALAGMLPPLLLSKPMLALGLAFALLVGVISGLLPGIGAMRMRVVNALRRV